MILRKSTFRIIVALIALCLAVAANGISAAAEEGKPPATGAASTARPPVSGTVVPLPPTPADVIGWPVSYEEAIKIASAYITPETLAQSKYYATQMGSGSSSGETHLVWDVVFVAQKLTKADLERKVLAPETYEPDHSYGTIFVRIDGTTGAFISKSVSFAMPRPIATDYPVNTPTPAMPPDRATGVPAGTGVATPGKVVTAIPMPAPWATDMPMSLGADEQGRVPAIVPGDAQTADRAIPPYVAPEENSHKSAGLPESARDNSSATNYWWVAAVAGTLIVLVASGYLTISHRRAVLKAITPQDKPEIQ